MKKIIFSLVFSFLFAECPEGYVEDDCGDCWASYCYDMSTHVPNYQTTEEACNEAGLLWVNPGDPGDPTFNSNCSSTGDGDDHGDGDGHDDDHECEECVETCSAYVMNNYGYNQEEASIWCLTTPNMQYGCADTCSDDDHGDDDHDDHDHGDEEHCEDLVDESSCTADDHCEWHADEMACEDAEGDHDDHDDDDHGDEEHNVFELTGLSVGSTTFSLLIMHQGHADFTSMPILATVEEEMVQCFSGDINNDSSLNVVDAVLMVNMILSGEQPDDMCTYDYNEDGQVNVVDVVQLVNHIIGISLSKANEASNIDVLTSNNSISIKSDGFVQGVQLTLSHGDDFAIEMADEYISDYRTNNNTTTLMVVTDGFKSVEDIANVSGKYVIEEVITSNSNASVNIITEVVSAFELKVVGPNPFNPTTKLNVVVEEAGYVSVKIYNLIGQVVATLADGYMEANPSGHTLNWDASLLSSGVYIVHAQNAGKVSTQKLTLLK